MTRICLTLCVWAVFLASGAHAVAGLRLVADADENSGVSIELVSPVDQAPMDGYMPCWVVIRNLSGAARSWDIICNAPTSGGFEGNVRPVRSSLRVENGQTGRLAVLLPPQPARGYYLRPQTIRVEGFGVTDGSLSIPGTRITASSHTPPIAMGTALASEIWGALIKEYADLKLKPELMGSPLDVTLLGSDWRELSGFEHLWLTEGEYAGLDPAQRAMIRRWVEEGGKLFLCAQALEAPLRSSLGLPLSGDEARPGFGTVTLVAWDGKTLSPGKVAAALGAPVPFRNNYSSSDASTWPMTKSVGTITLNSPFLITFIILFAIAVGPVNLFWLAKASRRHRLFWTTPLISVAASLLLIFVIVLEDGFGGRGERRMLYLLLPDQAEAYIVQEQVSRTGILFSRSFTAADDLSLTPIALGSFAGKSYDQTGRTYSGDWFASRAVQAQRATTFIGTHAKIQLLSAAGAPPYIVSSFDLVFSEIYYLDPDGHRWRGVNLGKGQHIVLQPEAAPAPMDTDGGSELFNSLLSRVGERRGYFYAVADNGPFIETLASVRWKKQRAIFIGPVTPAP